MLTLQQQSLMYLDVISMVTIDQLHNTCKSPIKVKCNLNNVKFDFNLNMSEHVDVVKQYAVGIIKSADKL